MPADDERRLRLTPASEIAMGSAQQIRLSNVVRQTVLEVLPEESGVLPDGRAAHSVLAMEIMRRAYPRNDD